MLQERACAHCRRPRAFARGIVYFGVDEQSVAKLHDSKHQQQQHWQHQSKLDKALGWFAQVNH